MGTQAEHREGIEVAGTRWLEAAAAYVAAWHHLNPDGVNSVHQQQVTEAEPMARAAYERALGAYRRHLRGESHRE